MMKRLVLSALAAMPMAAFAASPASACTATSFGGLTAAIVNPTGTVTGTVNATGCDIGVYYDATGVGGTVRNADVFGALSYGVVAYGDLGPVSVDVLTSTIRDIGDSPFNGNQRGVAIYYRAFLLGGSATGKVNGNTLDRYQKGGIVVNGAGSNVVVSNNGVSGFGPVGFIAQNGIQFGYGSSGSAMKNTVTGHQYTGSSTVSGGIIVVGGPGYGTCPDGSPCPYTTGIQIVQNKVVNNDVGVFLTNIDASGGAPPDATNIKVVNNTISNGAVTNRYCYQAGVSDVGNNDKIINNSISGIGYDSTACYAVPIDADPSFTNRPKVHAND